jgi:hypothetical protein
MKNAAVLNRKKWIDFIKRFKYEMLLLALIAHLFIGIFLSDLVFYIKIIWPVNMLILGLASKAVFETRNKIKAVVHNILWWMAVIIPVGLPFFGYSTQFMSVISIFYCLYFVYLFLEILRFLIKPSYINKDIILAAACGYFLMIEVSVFLLQVLFYQDSTVLSNIDTTSAALTFMDLVYFSSVSLTSTGFGDIVPTNYSTKLLVSFFGIISQFYLVVLVGIIISKFVNAQDVKS